MEQIEVAKDHLKKVDHHSVALWITCSSDVIVLLLLLQAMGLDDGKVYAERLRVSLHRLELRGELYKPFESPEDQAGQIIEQVRVHIGQHGDSE